MGSVRRAVVRLVLALVLGNTLVALDPPSVVFYLAFALGAVVIWGYTGDLRLARDAWRTGARR